MEDEESVSERPFSPSEEEAMSQDKKEEVVEEIKSEEPQEMEVEVKADTEVEEKSDEVSALLSMKSWSATIVSSTVPSVDTLAKYAIFFFLCCICSRRSKFNYFIITYRCDCW